MTDTSELGIY